jgi:hypothetical protein
MKVSSYHKQKGDTINFITNEFEINLPYDIMYITKRSWKIKAPPISILDRDNVRVWGEGFKFFTNYKLPPVIAATRPDYLLYPLKDTKSSRSDIVQFFDYNNKRITKSQDYRNIFKNKNTLVADENFWDAKVSEIIEVLNILKTAPNLSFVDPIKITAAISIDEFKLLKFTKEADLKWENDLGNSTNSAMEIASFLNKFKANNPSAKIGPIYFKAITENHYDKNKALLDIQRCLEIIDLGKINGLQFAIDDLDNKLDTPYAHIVNTLISWSQKGYKLSLYEYIAQPLCRAHNNSIEGIYMNPKTWDNESFIAILRLLEDYPQLKQYAMRRWKDKLLEITKIDWDAVSRHTKNA